MDLVCVIVINYNGVDDTNACVKSLLECGYKDLHIIIIDNNSRQGKVSYNEIIRKPKCTIIYNDENVGFSEANNIGITYAIQKLNTDYVLVLNNDTVVTEGFLKPLLNSCKLDDAIGIAIGKILYFDKPKMINFGGSVFNSKLGTCEIEGIGCEDADRYNHEKDIPFASGCMWLIPSKVVKKVGMMSNDYFLYYEDNDYSDKVLCEGYSIRYIPKSVIFHKGSKSTHRNIDLYHYYIHRNYLIYIKKTKILKTRIKFLKILKRFFVNLINVVHGDLNAKVFRYIWLDFITCRYGKCKRKL